MDLGPKGELACLSPPPPPPHDYEWRPISLLIGVWVYNIQLVVSNGSVQPTCAHDASHKLLAAIPICGWSSSNCMITIDAGC